MMRKRTRLYFKSVSEIVGGNGIGVITLTDADDNRAITIVCDAAMMYQIGLRSTNWQSRSKLLPEVLVTMLGGITSLEHYEMNIYAIVSGEYKVTIYNTETMQMSQIRLSDAVLLSRISPIPIYIDDELFVRQAAPYSSTSNKMAIPINTLPTDKLREELQKAIEKEDYRLAAILKEELSKRQDKGKEKEEEIQQ